MSWTVEKSSLMPDYRYKGFHKSNYVEPSRAKADVDQRTCQRHGLVQHFKEPGIEAKSEAAGLAYGSDKKYALQSQSKRLSFNEQLDKKQKQHKDLEDFMETHKQQKASMEAEKAEQKRKDLYMLQKYQPWGKPAGGAPRMTGDGERDTRRKRIEWESQLHDDNQSLEFGRPGGGAPRRTTSGKLQTSIVSDPTTKFQRSFKRDVDHVLRYKSPQKAQEYAESLDKQVLEQHPKERHSFPYQENDYNPYGKPGGGAPLQRGLVAATRRQFEDNEESEEVKKQNALRYARRLEQQRIESITRKAKESDELKQPSSYYPWEKSHPMRDSSGNVARHRQTLRQKMVVDIDAAPDSTETPRTRMPRTIGVHGEGTVLDPSVNKNDEVFDPWGRPGAGAPLKNNSGQVVTTTQNHFNDKKQAKRNETAVSSPRNTSDVIVERLGIKRQVDANSYAYHSELERQAELRYHQRQQDKAEQQRLALKHAARENSLWGCNDNPDPIRRKLVDPSEEQVKKEKATSYHSELAELANQKHQEKKQQRNQNLKEDQKHLETFSSQWGRPGGGAPRIDQQGNLDAAQRLTLLSNNASTYRRRS